MGGERTWKRKQLLLYLTCFMMVIGTAPGCQIGGIRSGQTGQGANAGNDSTVGYCLKSLSYQKDALKKTIGEMGEEELYQHGLILAHPLNPHLDYEKSMAYFQTVIRKFPESCRRGEAELWILTLENITEKDRRIETLIHQLTSQEASFQKNRKMNNRLKTRVKGLKSEIKTSHQQIEELKKQIETLKIIDLGIEKKKRKGTP